MQDGRTVVLVTAIGSMAADCVVRQLRCMGDTVVIGCDLHPAEWIAASASVDRFHAVASSAAPQAYLRDIERLCLQERVDYLLPLTDPEVDLLGARQEHFMQHSHTVVCTSAPAALDRARDKLAMAACLAGSGSVAVLPGLDAEHLRPDSFPLPILFKPRRGRSSQGHFIARTDTDLAYARAAFRNAGYCAQPWLDGPVYVADVVHQPSTGLTVAVCREELIRTANGAGMSVRMVDDPRLQAIACDAARHLGIRGCANIEFLKAGDRFLAMDCNPRFSAGVAFSVLAGYDMVRAHLDCFAGRPIPAARPYAERIYARSLRETEPAPTTAATTAPPLHTHPEMPCRSDN